MGRDMEWELGANADEEEAPREIVKPPSATGDSGWLVRFFESHFFCEWIAVTYLYKHEDLGVRDYLCNRMYSMPLPVIESYLFQLCFMLTHKPSPSLHKFMFDICSRSLRLALKVHWFLLAEAETGDDSEYLRTLQEKCQQAARIAPWPPLTDQKKAEKGSGYNNPLLKLLYSQHLANLFSLSSLQKVLSLFAPTMAFDREETKEESMLSLRELGKLKQEPKVYSPFWTRFRHREDSDCHETKQMPSQTGSTEKVQKETKDDNRVVCAIALDREEAKEVSMISLRDFIKLKQGSKVHPPFLTRFWHREDSDCYETKQMHSQTDSPCSTQNVQKEIKDDNRVVCTQETPKGQSPYRLLDQSKLGIKKNVQGIEADEKQAVFRRLFNYKPCNQIKINVASESGIQSNPVSETILFDNFCRIHREEKLHTTADEANKFSHSPFYLKTDASDGGNAKLKQGESRTTDGKENSPFFSHKLCRIHPETEQQLHPISPNAFAISTPEKTLDPDRILEKKSHYCKLDAKDLGTYKGDSTLSSFLKQIIIKKVTLSPSKYAVNATSAASDRKMTCSEVPEEVNASMRKNADADARNCVQDDVSNIDKTFYVKNSLKSPTKTKYKSSCLNDTEQNALTPTTCAEAHSPIATQDTRHYAVVEKDESRRILDLFLKTVY